MLEDFLIGAIRGFFLVLSLFVLRKIYKKIDSNQNGCLIFVVGSVALVLIAAIVAIVVSIYSSK